VFWAQFYQYIIPQTQLKINALATFLKILMQNTEIPTAIKSKRTLKPE